MQTPTNHHLDTGRSISRSLEAYKMFEKLYRTSRETILLYNFFLMTWIAEHIMSSCRVWLLKLMLKGPGSIGQVGRRDRHSKLHSILVIQSFGFLHPVIHFLFLEASHLIYLPYSSITPTSHGDVWQGMEQANWARAVFRYCTQLWTGLCGCPHCTDKMVDCIFDTHLSPSWIDV